MESWLPWLSDREHLLPDLLPRRRPRAARRAQAHARPRPGAPRRGGRARVDPLGDVGRDAPVASSRVCRCRSTACSRTRRRAATALLAAPESPDTPHLAGTGFDPVVGDTEALAAGCATCATAAPASCSPPTEKGRRVASTTCSPAKASTTIRGVAPGEIGIVVAPLERGVVVPAAGLAVIAEADLTGRRRVHRAPRGARRGADFYDDARARRLRRALPARRRALQGDDHARDRRRRARLPAARVPSR